MKNIKILITIAVASLTLTSCFKDLDLKPLDENTYTVDRAYSTEISYTQGLAKIYSVMAISVQDGAGQAATARSHGHRHVSAGGGQERTPRVCAQCPMSASQQLRPVVTSRQTHADWHQAAVGSCTRRLRERRLHEVLRP